MSATGLATRRCFLGAGAGAGAAWRAIAAEEAPAWLREAARTPAPAGAKAPAIVLFDERRIVVEDDARVTQFRSRAVRVLAGEGRDEARASEVYLQGSGKIKDLKAWLLTPSGETRQYGKESRVDIAVGNGDLYNEIRVAVIAAARDAAPGSVFGFEIAAEDRSVFTQFQWEFQSEIPVVQSRFRITVPEGWRVEGVLLNRAPVTPTAQGRTTTWELRDLAYLEREPACPSAGSLFPRLAVSYFPPEGRATAMRVIRNWQDVSRWITELSDPRAAPDAAIHAKARELAGGAGKPWDTIRAAGRFVQDTKYVSIQTGMGRGGGYQPHPAPTVLAKGYGDCKDKANLLRSLLAAAGIPSYPVCVYAGDRTYVKPAWASPQQFNHAILAVRVDAGVAEPAVLDAGPLGRLLFFDPTDPFTPAGLLPGDEQGSYALVAAGDQGQLVKLPVAAPAVNLLEREIEYSLTGEGDAAGWLEETSRGAHAARARALLARASPAEYRASAERWVTRSAPNAALGKLTTEDEDGVFRLRVEFTAARYAKRMAGRLLVFRPIAILRRSSWSFPAEQRRTPVLLEAERVVERVRVRFPPSFKVDELPSSGQLEAPFARIRARTESGENLISRESILEVDHAVVEPEAYAELRNFFARARGAETAPAVLAS